MVYLGPVAPHWEVQSDFGDSQMVDDFCGPWPGCCCSPHDPQFKEPEQTAAERENVLLDWDLGVPDQDAYLT
jgi:hypothetical protein